MAEFWQRKSGSDGLAGSCRTCMQTYYAARRASAPPKARKPPYRGGRGPTTSIIDGLKRCTACGDWKSPDKFYPHKLGKDGLAPECKPCKSKRAAPASKRWREANRAHRAEQNREWCKANRAPARDRLREWETEHPEQALDAKRIKQQRRRARERGAEPRFTRDDWLVIKAAYGGRCAYCGKESQRLTIDHVIALSRGGEHTPANVVPACRACNSTKNAGPAPTHQPHLALLHGATRPVCATR